MIVSARKFILISCLAATAVSFATEIFSNNSPRHTHSKAEVAKVSTIAPRREHKNFAELRHEVLGLIGGATRRLWISTPYLTDGEIASSLFMAKYRRLDVKVLLGARKANGYMSRLGFLKKQNIPVFLMPRDYPYQGATLILADDRLVRVNSNLDVKAINMRSISSEVEDQQDFVNSFKLATSRAIPAVARPTPRVGRPGQFNNVYRPTAGGLSGSVSSRVESHAKTSRADGSYDYNYKTPEKAAPDMPRRLPKQTIQQKKFMDEFKNKK